MTKITMACWMLTALMMTGCPDSDDNDNTNGNSPDDTDKDDTSSTDNDPEESVDPKSLLDEICTTEVAKMDDCDAVTDFRGTWQSVDGDGTSTLTLNGDGTMTYVDEYDGETDEDTGAWCVKGNQFFADFSDGDELEVEVFTTVISEDRFFDDILLRESGSGESGVWKNIEAECEQETDGDETFTEKGVEVTTVTIDGDEFNYEEVLYYEETGEEGGEEKEYLKGAVQWEGDKLVITIEDASNSDFETGSDVACCAHNDADLIGCDFWTPADEIDCDELLDPMTRVE